MMVLRRPSHQIAWRPASHTYPADQLVFCQQVDDAVDGSQADIRMFPPDPLEQFGRSQVVLTPGDGPENGMSLGRQAMSLLPQHTGDPVSGQSHSTNFLMILILN